MRQLRRLCERIVRYHGHQQHDPGTVESRNRPFPDRERRSQGQGCGTPTLHAQGQPQGRGQYLRLGPLPGHTLQGPNGYLVGAQRRHQGFHRGKRGHAQSQRVG